ncbi:PIF-like protein [Mya arenaria]|uniref:PIF-like protein n=1 Tax=Mya arenaria TaxID=6604 RepID=A0ABY7E1J4_MYAAR|nr:protein PIF-like [Mya arenaria]WAR03873.1 PIF-like protein [Mya arenaria]
MTRCVTSSVILGCLCAVVLLHVTNAQVQLKEPNVCDNATIKNTVGYNPHPRDCTMFVQCFYVTRGKGQPPKVEPVYRSCEYGMLWDHSKLRCLPSYRVDCSNDLCKKGAPFYKHKDPNRCGAYYECVDGKPHARCCPKGQGFHPRRGCIDSASCTDMCPFEDRVPGCKQRPISGAPTKYQQYTDNGKWVTERCPSGRMFSAADCDCSITGLVKVGRVCKPDVKMTFDDGTIRDVSGNNYDVRGENVITHAGAAYFRGDSKLLVQPLRPSEHDEGNLIIKFKIREDARRGYRKPMQALFTNGHCGEEATVLILKVKGQMKGQAKKQTQHFMNMGATSVRMNTTINFAIINKPWTDVIYVFDGVKIEGRVCGAVKRDWCVGDLKQTSCGFQFGYADVMGFSGFIGLMDEIEIYRCKPLDTVINVNY